MVDHRHDATILAERLEATMASWRIGRALATRAVSRPALIDDPALAAEIDLVINTEAPYVLLPRHAARQVFGFYFRREADLAAGRLTLDAAITAGERRIESLLDLGAAAELAGGWLACLDQLDHGGLGILELAAGVEPGLSPVDGPMRPALLLHFWLHQIAARRIDYDPPQFAELLGWLSWRGLPQASFDLPSDNSDVDADNVVPFRPRTITRPGWAPPPLTWATLAASGADRRDHPDDRETNDLTFIFRPGRDGQGRAGFEAIVTHRTGDAYAAYPLGQAFRLTIAATASPGIAPLVSHRRLVFGPGERGGLPVARAWFEPMPGLAHHCSFDIEDIGHG